MLPEDVYNSIRKASADISHYVEVRSSPPPPPMRDGASWHLPVCRSPDKPGSGRQTVDQRPYNAAVYQDWVIKGKFLQNMLVHYNYLNQEGVL
jgi:hypothetical protein